MTPQVVFLIIVGCFCVSTITVCIVTNVFLRRLNRRGERAPVADKLLRPAGESLRLKMETISERLSFGMVLAMFIPGLALASILLSAPDGSMSMTRATVAFAVCLALLLFFTQRVFKLAHELRSHRLGYRGECAVGEELNQLMLEGCHVFHDVPMEPYGNIDHVIVAPSGVFAVETKTRRKRKAPAGRKEHEVIYDGKTLDFPHCKDAQGLEQAQHQADRLRTFLSKAVGEPVPVEPLLTFPGWFVTTSVARASIKVLNPKQIRGAVLNGREQKLSRQLADRIIHQLDQKCRDVEF